MAKQNGKESGRSKVASGRAKVTPIRKAEPDVNQLAHHLVKMTTECVAEDVPTEDEMHRVMAELGRRGGRIGGRARAELLTKERRSEIALKAARSRWDAVKRKV